MIPSRTIMVLGLAVAVLGGAAAIGGILAQESGESVAFVSARGETVELFGRGLYRYDSVFSGANFRAQDIVTVVIAVPLLLASLLWYRRGSLRGGLLLTAALGFFLYEYASMALMAAFSAFFLVYVAAMSAALFGLILIIRSLERSIDETGLAEDLPNRFGGIYMIAAGLVTIFVWLLPLLGAQLSGGVPDHLDHYTTMVTDALDLAVITPTCFIAGVLMLRKRALGYIVAMPLLGTIVMLLFLISGGTISQIAEGVIFTPAEIIGPIAGFAVLGLAGAVLLVLIVRRLPPVLHRGQPAA